MRKVREKFLEVSPHRRLGRSFIVNPVKMTGNNSMRQCVKIMYDMRKEIQTIRKQQKKFLNATLEMQGKPIVEKTEVKNVPKILNKKKLKPIESKRIVLKSCDSPIMYKKFVNTYKLSFIKRNMKFLQIIGSPKSIFST